MQNTVKFVTLHVNCMCVALVVFCVSVIRLCLIIVADWTLSGWQWCWPTNRSFCIYLLNMLVGVRSQCIETFYYTRILVFHARIPNVSANRYTNTTTTVPLKTEHIVTTGRLTEGKTTQIFPTKKKRCQRDENVRAAVARARYLRFGKRMLRTWSVL